MPIVAVPGGIELCTTKRFFFIDPNMGSRKKKFFSQWPGHKEGGGVKGRAIKEKMIFFITFFSNVPKFQRPLSSRGGRLGLNGPFIKRRIFFAASLCFSEAPTKKSASMLHLNLKM